MLVFIRLGVGGPSETAATTNKAGLKTLTLLVNEQCRSVIRARRDDLDPLLHYLRLIFTGSYLGYEYLAPGWMWDARWPSGACLS
jgi:hypothetical protein